MLVRSLAIRHFRKAATPAFANPAVASVFSGKISAGSRSSLFSTKPQKRDDELLQKVYSDAFDESDSIEVGKQAKTEQHLQKEPQLPKEAQSHGFRGHHFPSLMAGFDDLFGRADPFAHPFFSTFHEPIFDRLMPVLKSFPANPRATLLRSSPGYEIKESDDTYEIVMDVPEGIQSSDMKVEVEHHGTVLHVSGGRKVEQEGRVSTTQFDKRFTIGHNVEKDKLTANLSGGVLVVKAPKVEKSLEAKQTIAITDNPHESHKED